MHTLSVSSLKGGVGKTTIALGLASAAIAKGMRTLVIDLDPQSDATTGLGAIGNFKTTSADVLVAPKHSVVMQSIVASSWTKYQASTCDVMVGSTRNVINDVPEPTLDQIWSLDHAMAHLENRYDLVIIDTPPSINRLTRSAWLASELVLIVAEPSIYSVVAAERAARAVSELRDALSSRLDLLGVVVNRVRPGSSEHEFRIRELANIFGPRLLATRLEDRAALQQVAGATRALHNWPGAEPVAAQFDELLARTMVRFAQHRAVTRSNTAQKRGGARRARWYQK